MSFPSFDDIKKELHTLINEDNANLVPIIKYVPQISVDVTTAFQRVCGNEKSIRKYSFLLESSEIRRGFAKGQAAKLFSIIGTEPFAVKETFAKDGDPLKPLEEEMKKYRSSKRFYDQQIATKYYPIDLVNGGAVGYIGYDCIRFFESKLEPFYGNDMRDVLEIPESLFMFSNSFVSYDHAKNAWAITALCVLSEDLTVLQSNYAAAIKRIEELEDRLKNGNTIDFEENQDTLAKDKTQTDNQKKYEGMVEKLRERIIDGDIIQCVPSQRVSRPINKLHPFRIYEQLRDLNPSRYMFYVELEQFQLVGSSPELLVKIDTNGVVVNHPIAGTRRRGDTEEEDIALEKELLSDEKERAEHIQLVDLGRNDVNRVADPVTTKVDSLMHIERYSHVMHIVSQVSGKLRPQCTIYDAFRSIFPAGTLSGAPKIKAMEFIASLEKEKRGVYGGAVGFFSFIGSVDTCIAIRTIVTKDGKAYLQAGGGIVFDSKPFDEYMETVNKMAATARAIDIAEEKLKERLKSDSGNLTLSKYVFSPLYNQLFGALSTKAITVSSGIPKPVDHYKGRLLLIDNYDSFTFNVYQYLCQLKQEVIVFRNDKISIEDSLLLKVDRLVISPGPSWPKDAGISKDIINAFAGKVPILGVCLGHECMVEVFGGVIEHCGEIKHGKTSKITHDGKGVFSGIPNPVEVIRYHSLAANRKSLEASDVIVTSETSTGIIMGIRHKKMKIEGVQFHPESIKTEYGHEMLQNFVQWEGPYWE